MVPRSIPGGAPDFHVDLVIMLPTTPNNYRTSVSKAGKMPIGTRSAHHVAPFQNEGRLITGVYDSSWNKKITRFFFFLILFLHNSSTFENSQFRYQNLIIDSQHSDRAFSFKISITDFAYKKHVVVNRKSKHHFCCLLLQ